MPKAGWQQEGWSILPGSAKSHYYRANVSLCGRPDPIAGGSILKVYPTSVHLSPYECKVCWARRVAEVSI